MTSVTIPILVALLLQVGLGVVVFHANWHRRSNQCFLLLSFVTAAWLGSLYFAVEARDALTAVYSIRVASAAGIGALVVFNLLRGSIVNSRERWSVIPVS